MRSKSENSLKPLTVAGRWLRGLVVVAGLAGGILVAQLGAGSLVSAINCADGTVTNAATCPTPTPSNNGIANVGKNDCQGENVRAGGTGEDRCAILDLLLVVINAMSAIVGVVIVAVIVAAGIRYSAAGDDPNAVSDAKKRIRDALIALFMYIFMFAFLQWVVPGGVF